MTQGPAALWHTTLGQLQLLVTQANYDTWLRDTVGLRHEGEHFVVGALNDFATEWLGTRLRPLITKTLAGVLGHPVDVAFEVARPHEDEAPPPLLAVTPPASGAPATRHRGAAPPALQAWLTFDTFVVGEENALAYEAARRVVATPGVTNPLLLCGSPGMGKTHLLSAIGHAAHDAGRSVIYATAERFGNDYVRALGNGIDGFRGKYRAADVVLIDDVQFFEGKQKFQEEFFHTFNELHAAGRQVVVSVDRVPSALDGVSDALRSRLSWGLVADLQRPCYETRLAILRAKAARHAAGLPDAALAAIAERCCPSVRELEGFLNRVIAYLPLIGGAMTQENIERALSPLAPAGEPETPSADDVVAAVCARSGVQPGDLRGKSRQRDVTYARHLAMYVLKEDAHMPVSAVGRVFGGRDHATVLAGVKRIALELVTRAETSADLHAVRESLAARRPTAIPAPRAATG